jgi:hypothetical protein
MRRLDTPLFAAAGRKTAGLAEADRVFDIVELERETQAAASSLMVLTTLSIDADYICGLLKDTMNMDCLGFGLDGLCDWELVKNT